MRNVSVGVLSVALGGWYRSVRCWLLFGGGGWRACGSLSRPTLGIPRSLAPPYASRRGRMAAPLGSRLRGNDVGVRGNDGLFTLTLTLSHLGRGDVAPGTGPLGYRRSRAATSGMGVWLRWLRLVGCWGVCAVHGARYRGRCRFRRRWLSLRLRIGRASLWTRTRWARP